jgi:hypothetical protein
MACEMVVIPKGEDEDTGLHQRSDIPFEDPLLVTKPGDQEIKTLKKLKKGMGSGKGRVKE